jgi:hypothetical protein
MFADVSEQRTASIFMDHAGYILGNFLILLLYMCSCLNGAPRLAYTFTLKTEVVSAFETSMKCETTRRHILEPLLTL